MDPAQNIPPFLLPEWVSVQARPLQDEEKTEPEMVVGERIVGRIQAEAEPGSNTRPVPTLERFQTVRFV